MPRDELAGKLPFSAATLYRIEIGARGLGELEALAFVAAVAKETGLPRWFFTDDFDEVQEPAPSTAGPELGRQLSQLRRELRTGQGETLHAIENIARSSAHDRGRLTKMEKKITRIGEVLLEDLRRRAR